MGYLTTPEEYEQQHYEGGHTVYGTWTSLLARDVLRELTAAMAAGAPAPAPDQPATLGGTEPGTRDVGDGGVQGRLVTQPATTVARHGLVEIAWTGAPGGVDRPVDAPFLLVERKVAGGLAAVDSDLRGRIVWEEADGDYTARYDVPAGAPVGPHRMRVVSGSYTLTTRTFDVVPAESLRVLGAELVGRTLVLRAQNPTPDTTRSVAWRPVSPEGGHAAVLRARWAPGHRDVGRRARRVDRARGPPARRRDAGGPPGRAGRRARQPQRRSRHGHGRPGGAGAVAGPHGHRQRASARPVRARGPSRRRASPVRAPAGALRMPRT
jgi:hypothetical protein